MQGALKRNHTNPSHPVGMSPRFVVDRFTFFSQDVRDAAQVGGLVDLESLEF